MKAVSGQEDWPARVRRLEEEVAGLRRAMRTRGLIEQAKGMIAERLGCDPESAFTYLSARSQETNVPLVRIAADLVGAPPQLPGTGEVDSPATPQAPGSCEVAVGSTADPDWVRSVLAAVHGAAHLLLPVRAGDGTVIDFAIEAVSADATESDRAALGRRLLDAYPHLAGNGVFAAYTETLAGGALWQRRHSSEEIIVNGRKRRILVSRRASRVGGAVLASWQRLDETISKDRRLARLEAFGGYGWAEWDLNTGDARWSPGMYRLFGKDSSREPPPLDALIERADPADHAHMERFVADALSGRDCVVDVRLAGSGQPRWLRLFCEAQAPESPHKVIALLVQDVSERYSSAQRLRSIQSRAAAGRLRLASQQDLTARLVNLLYPKETVNLSTPAATVVGRHYLGETDQSLRADFCDAIELPDGKTLMMIGDMFGAGMTAAATAVRVVRPVIALGIAGVPLTRILEVLNTDLRRDEDLSLASLLLSTFDPLTGDFCFGSAGHLPPILLRPRPAAARPLGNGIGPALGLIENPQYQEQKVCLATGDAVVCYTDGVIDQRADAPLKALTKLLSDRYRRGGARALLEAAGADVADEACIAILEVAGLNRT